MGSSPCVWDEPHDLRAANQKLDFAANLDSGKCAMY